MTYQMPEVSVLGRAEALVQFGCGNSLEPDLVTQTWHIYPATVSNSE
jgi:hypothetical protein